VRKLPGILSMKLGSERSRLTDAKGVFEKWMNRLTEKYRDSTSGSASAYEKAQKYLPGGDTRTGSFSCKTADGTGVSDSPYHSWKRRLRGKQYGLD
jgi:hypothetical protein